MWIDNVIFKEDMDYILHSKCIEWEKLENSSILVTGATGLIGLTLISALVYANTIYNLNIKIFAIVRNKTKANAILKKQLDVNNGLYLINADIKDYSVCSRKYDYIIHAASPTSSQFFVNNPVETIQTAICGTMNMLEIARMSKSKGMVFLSSMEAYGRIESEKSLLESDLGYIDLLNVRNSYPESKRMCEMLCNTYAIEYGIPVMSIRLAQTFGPGVSYHDNRVFAMMARCAINKENILLSTKGSSRHPYLYTAQAVTAIFCVLLRGKKGKIYNASNPETYCSIYEMGQMVVSQLANDQIKIITADENNCKLYPDASFLNMNIDALIDLGWKPKGTLIDMYKRMISTMNEI